MRHAPTAQLVNLHDKLFLIDCGEGTQMQLRRYRIKFQRIHHIFISHLHGDHYLGLMGLISSMHLLGRTKPLHLFAPPAIQRILETQFEASETRLNFEIVYHSTDVKERTLLHEDRTLRVYGFPLKHRVQCTGFFFEEKARKLKVTKDVIAEYQLQVHEIVQLKNGEDVIRETGEVLPHEALTVQPLPVRSYAFCSDTAYSEKVIEAIQGCSLLYHEATFLEDLKSRAKATFHSTAKEAGMVAAKAGAKKLVIGHFSSRYMDETPLLEEARETFPDTELAAEGLTFEPLPKVTH